MQYPFGEMEPSTIWQLPFAFASWAGMKNLHSAQCMLPFGVFRYCIEACVAFDCAPARRVTIPPNEATAIPPKNVRRRSPRVVIVLR